MRMTILAALAAGVLLAGATPSAVAAPPAVLWVGGWAASQVKPGPSFPFGWSLNGFENQTVRQVVRVSTGGVGVRIRLSNLYGDRPLHLTGANIARAAGGTEIQPNTSRRLTFRSSESVVIPAGGEVASDPAWLRTAPLESLTVSLYFAEPTGPATYHWYASATTYRANGDHRADTAAGAYTSTSLSWYYLAGVDVLGLVPRDAIVTLGDSITDGANSTVDRNNRYPDELAERLVAARQPHGVLNAGIGANRLLHNSACFGQAALMRLRRDVLDEPRARAVIVLVGINDIRVSQLADPCFEPNPVVSAADLIAGHREIIKQAHRHGLTVVGATLLPFKGDGLYTEHGEQVREDLNTWIRSSGEYDAVADFDRALADPVDPNKLRADYDSGDHLHPNDVGMRAMANAIDLGALQYQ